jgi:indole-3-glycerol phosphate synthase
VSVLDRILARVSERLEETRRERPLAAIRREGESAARRASFRAAIAAPGMTIVAEAKRASPSKGILRDPYEPVALARAYESAGAGAISVLTEPDFFLGSPDDLRRVAVATSLPILRKDFTVAEDQIWEARAWGASAVLLIVAALDDSRVRDLAALAGEIGLDALVEVHTEAEAERALYAGARLLGVNNRDLVTFATDLGTTARIARVVPPDARLVSESGISTRADVLAVERAGAHGVLVGETLLRARDPGRKLAELRGDA